MNRLLKSGIVMLMLSLNATNASAQQALTPRLIFDFNPDDEFQYHTSGFSNYTWHGGKALIILDKWIAAGNDTVTYAVKQNTYTQQVDQNSGAIIDTLYTTSFDTISYTNLDTDIKQLPWYNNSAFPNYQQLYDLLMLTDSSCTDFLTFQDTLMDWDLAGIGVESYWAAIDLGFSTCNNYSQSKSNRFGKGIGNISGAENYSGGPYYGNGYMMTYFKKDTVTAGTPNIYLTGVNNLPKNQWKLYPNPSDDYINIASEVGMPIKNYTIVNAQGSIVLSGYTNTTSLVISLIDLPNGIYTLLSSDALKLRFVIAKP